MTGALWAISDLHVGHPANRAVVEEIRPASSQDWLIVAGDVAESPEQIRWALGLLRSRFAKVIWVPGNHELWTTARDPATLRGEARYQSLVRLCRELDVVTPEDEYPLWTGDGGPAVVAPLFLLYDYSFLPAGIADKAQGLAVAERRRVTAGDEHLLAFEPYPSRDAWCHARVAATAARLDAVDPVLPLVLVNHWPLRQEPTMLLFPPEFSLWCGTVRTADWHRRYNVACAVYGHLHLRRADRIDGVRFEEVSLGYPREWQRRGRPDPLLRRILPAPARTPDLLGLVPRSLIAQTWRLARALQPKAR
ncbi:MAG: metallophosphoesterase [Mycobacteriaceae bacterium]|nr:metallophosphoesterase [Mycobacteriaceae bacterium]